MRSFSRLLVQFTISLLILQTSLCKQQSDLYGNLYKTAANFWKSAVIIRIFKNTCTSRPDRIGSLTFSVSIRNSSSRPPDVLHQTLKILPLRDIIYVLSHRLQCKSLEKRSSKFCSITASMTSWEILTPRSEPVK